MGSVGVDAGYGPTGDLAAAIGAMIDSARAEAQQPTQEEIEAAASAVADHAKSIDMEVLFSSQQSANAVAAAEDGKSIALQIALKPSQW